MIKLLPRIADMLLGFGWGFVVFYAIPKMVKEHRNIGESSQWANKEDVK